jgi:uncharacterized membrane protein
MLLLYKGGSVDDMTTTAPHYYDFYYFLKEILLISDTTGSINTCRRHDDRRTSDMHDQVLNFFISCIKVSMYLHVCIIITM